MTPAARSRSTGASPGEEMKIRNVNREGVSIGLAFGPSVAAAYRSGLDIVTPQLIHRVRAVCARSGALQVSLRRHRTATMQWCLHST
jgi:hypothetical protein